jgi:hypothetical protein
VELYIHNRLNIIIFFIFFFVKYTRAHQTCRAAEKLYVCGYGKRKPARNVEFYPTRRVVLFAAVNEVERRSKKRWWGPAASSKLGIKERTYTHRAGWSQAQFACRLRSWR